MFKKTEKKAFTLGELRNQVGLRYLTIKFIKDSMIVIQNNLAGDLISPSLTKN
jgi:hypothetical protein